MPVLTFEEYDQSYFDGEVGPLSHNAGYSSYGNWVRRDPGLFPESIPDADGLTREFTDYATMLSGRFNLNQEYVELGSAYGYIVQAARAAGVQAWGVDVSQYAYDQAAPEVQPYLIVQDALSWLGDQRRNQWDICFTRWFMCCFDDAGAVTLIDEMNRVFKQQIHILMNNPNVDYYNVHTLQEWHDLFDWEVGTILTADRDFDNYLTKIN